MEEEMIERAEAYAARRARYLAGRLGFGIYGMVFVLEGNDEPGASALKIHQNAEPYSRERDVYGRLAETGIRTILDFSVPGLIACDDRLLAIEMTIVQPPLVLDFAGAWLDFPPRFADEVWAERREKWAEEFGPDWPKAQEIMAELENMGIHMLDPSPSNLRFR